MRPIYTAPTAEAAALALDRLAESWGAPLSHVGGQLAQSLGWLDGLLQIPVGVPSADLHHQCHREPAFADAKEHCQSEGLPARRRGDQDSLLEYPQLLQPLVAAPRLGYSDESARGHFRRSIESRGDRWPADCSTVTRFLLQSRAATCCTKCSSAQTSANRRMYIRLRGENPFMSGNARLRSAEDGRSPWLPSILAAAGREYHDRSANRARPVHD